MKKQPQAAKLWPTGIESFARNRAGRDLAVGDIHGSFTRLQRALDAIGFDETRDRLFGVGDLVDRGPESNQVLQWLDKPWFHSTCGNHDFMAWRRALGLAYQEVDHGAHGGQWLDWLTQDDQQEMGDRLSALPLAIEVATDPGMVGLIHADCPCDDWQRFRDALQMDCVDPWIPQACLWSTDRYRGEYHGHIEHVHAVIHGHMTIERAARFGNVHFIDTGGWHEFGHFTFMDLNSLKVLRGPGGGCPRRS